MTYKELYEKMEEYASELDNSDKDDWYDTQRGYAEEILRQFREYLEGERYAKRKRCVK